jgi:hypothetical protein
VAPRRHLIDAPGTLGGDRRAPLDHGVGVDDGHTWIGGLFGPGHDPLLFSADGTPKPAYAAVVSAFAAGR